VSRKAVRHGIAHWPASERPRERLLAQGADASTDAQENREELRIRQGIGALRQEPLTRPFACRPMGNAVADRLSAHLDSP